MQSKVKTAAIVAAALVTGMVLGQAGPVRAQLGGILKGGIVLVAVDKLAPQINSFVNTVTGNKPGEDSGQSTKVVPILSVGRGGYAGAVQVSGPSELVDQVRAVAQVEGQTRILSSDVRIKGLIPVSARSVSDLSSLSRVKGVGISALIDIKL